jgi:hypothetical protein
MLDRCFLKCHPPLATLCDLFVGGNMMTPYETPYDPDAQQREWERQYGKVIAKAWSDGDFKKRLLANPAEVLKSEGLKVPPGVQVKVVESTDELFHIILPPKPREELSEEDLKAIAMAPAYTWCHNCKSMQST